MTRDLQFGHAVMFGMGGTLVEIFRDVSFRIVPFSEKDAAEMIGETRGAKLLEGVRGGKPADVAALRRLLVQVSGLVTRHPEIDEMDLNPVIVHEKGLTVVDSRIVLSARRTGIGALTGKAGDGFSVRRRVSSWMNRAAAPRTSSGRSECGEWPQCGRSSDSAGPLTCFTTASTCLRVPYWSSSPWTTSTGHSMAGRYSSMFHSRNSGLSQTSDHPRNIESVLLP